MKNRKKQFLKIGIAVLVIAVAGIVAGVVRYRIDNRFDLTVGGHTISKDEYVNCMKSVEYDTEVQIQQDYDAVYEDGFWEKKYDGKYGYEILTENTVEQLKYIHAVYDLAEEYKFQILAMEVMPDHIHLLVDCRPQFYISDMIKIMKGNIARQMFLAHPELKKELWGGHLWNPSYCAVTVSDRSREQVCSYIEGQKEK